MTSTSQQLVTEVIALTRRLRMPYIANRRRKAQFSTGKTFESWRADASSIPAATQQALRTLEWVRRAENLAVVARPARATRTCSKRSATPRSTTG